MPTKSLIHVLLLASTAWCQPQTLITGLQSPVKLILTPRGNFLVTETSMSTNSGRVSFVSRAGVRRSLIEGLPSGTEVTLAGGSGPAAMALRVMKAARPVTGNRPLFDIEEFVAELRSMATYFSQVDLSRPTDLLMRLC